MRRSVITLVTSLGVALLAGCSPASETNSASAQQSERANTVVSTNSPQSDTPSEQPMSEKDVLDPDNKAVADLQAELETRAASTVACLPTSTPNSPYCHPTTGDVQFKDAMTASFQMKSVDETGLSCQAGDGQACLTQMKLVKVLNKNGWCQRPTLGVSGSGVLVWTRCSAVEDRSSYSADNSAQ